MNLKFDIVSGISVEHPLIVDVTRMKLKPSYEGIQHDERTGLGRLWVEGTRENVRDGNGPDILYEQFVYNRFHLPKARCVTGDRLYRPKALARHRDYLSLY